MLNFAICDDEHIEIEHLSSLVREWAAKRDVSVRISDFESAESFLFSYEDDPSIDILLLDIQMQKMDGVDLARKIRQDNENIQIIFITGYPDFIAEGYEVSALHYLMKPVKKEKLSEVLDKAIKRLSKLPEVIMLEVESGVLRLSVDEILYIEVLDHFLGVETTTEKHRVKMPLREFETKLPDNFVRCHRSFIANMHYIKKITRTDVILDSGKTLPLSRRLYADVNKAMITYLKGDEKND